MDNDSDINDIASLLGRILLAIIFITSGFGKITGLEGTAGYIASKGLPLPMVLAAGAAVVELVGGLLLVVGFKARWAGLVLAVFTIAAAVLFHDYWHAAAAERAGQEINFWKNISMTGGLLLAFAFGPGRYSLDRK